jgi:predicted glutamine amidotransferase
MCRMFGLVSAWPVSQRALLVDAPRSLGALSREHPDGWGLALSDGEAWTLHKSVRAAAACELYDRVAREARASLAIAHVRQKTVGETALENTHPFVRGRFVLAHNGTVKATTTLMDHSSPERLAELRGQTDSERLFAFLMSFIDAACDVAIGLRRAIRVLLAQGDPGSVNFLLSDGATLYAFRFGRTLHLLERGRGTRGTSRRTPSVTLASERLTDEPWTEIAQGALLAVERGPEPRVTELARI